MMAANYRHIGGLENRLGRHYSRFSTSWPAAPLAAQSLARRKLPNHGSNRPSQAKAEVTRFIEKLGFEAIVLHERPNKGRALITKFREESDGAGFAVVLM